MGNEVTEKLVLFLQNLRCEDAGRETLVHLVGSKREKKFERSSYRIREIERTDACL